ncbi:2-hydroxychromene-2-carboxylate isomerase [Tistlia consotensis]|uniref:2-hydroxychromene-2-carboxylate isomerase n=1 Tax=Tistlia consotensis USBA 355 TaxID=560819 RepID=A0A1Y6BRB9_9PROT|nr:2-hydroxychromene-2-carboxylate isomerase [Tistlia consotensis]SMF21556.1 2-hydroxychromene-2-carboxylate isomerase [Tistlia consotensis USBA 355]SNR46809.1 2-hydroxychromene-2-carboxylate isomerase [Tistlia consotensis]
MAAPIDFYFDFSSPYGYLASERIDALAARHGRSVVWRPFLLGAVFKTTRTEPLLNIPLKGDYARRDIERSARALGVPYRLPESFPFLSVAACRAFYWLAGERPDLARDLAQALYRRAFAEGGDISRADSVVAVAEGLGVERPALEAALQDAEVKDRLRREVEAAVATGVFGSPFMVVDGEPFWGNDRLDAVERWLETGGW